LTIFIIIIAWSSCKEAPKRQIKLLTSVAVNWDSSHYTLNSADAYITNNQVSLVLNDTLNSGEGFQIELQNNGMRDWDVQSVTASIIPLDCLYVASVFRVLKHNVKLNFNQYKKEDLLEGSLDVFILGRKGIRREPKIPFEDQRKWDTIHLNGYVATLVD
ncbi:MAG TPA: hypothetical protein VF476_11990, partial [Chitinophagaceae bacterium]